MKREYPEYPIIGVGGVIFHGSSVLLVQRGQEPGMGQWSLPGGAVELGETLINALKREIEEEVSIEEPLYTGGTMVGPIQAAKPRSIKSQNYFITGTFKRMPF
jgi:ADP-ribose pyrophosphatase YjhB (NUDIX family)